MMFKIARHKPDLDLTTNGQKIERVIEYRYLGLNSNIAHFLYINIAIISLEVLDFEFNNLKVHYKSRASILMICLGILLWIDET